MQKWGSKKLEILEALLLPEAVQHIESVELWLVMLSVTDILHPAGALISLPGIASFPTQVCILGRSTSLRSNKENRMQIRARAPSTQHEGFVS